MESKSPQSILDGLVGISTSVVKASVRQQNNIPTVWRDIDACKDVAPS